ncbi:unnamed protein product [Sphenostylis stenocarpa]|uniref:Peptidase C14 caspase domain-containing protein n=1 Tax=Sphenostylis stenocarpa TaxID=92480 RepID=A0AA86VKI7_9FABA|nr:unnamed protein product [Sphenostylis stenocarpa]
MDGKNKSRGRRKGAPFHSNTTTPRCPISKRVGEGKLICSGCKYEFVLPTISNAYRCYKCEKVSNSPSLASEQSTKQRGSFKRDHQPNDYNNNTNGASPRRLSPSSTSSFSFSTPGHKRAVLCGVTYRKRTFKLEGTINDVDTMITLLRDKFKFPNECIRVLTGISFSPCLIEEEQDPNLIPTKKNILDSLNWLVSDCQSEGSLVFYFSGHGFQQPEQQKGDEIDGLDETLCPVDFLREGMITDNEINSIIVQPLKKGVTLHAIIDACHSGTTLDLVYLWKKEKSNWKCEEHRPPHCKEKQTSGGVAICLSACEDSQMAVDTAGFDGKYNGIMTYLFSKIIRGHPQITYAILLEKIHEEIEQIRQSKLHNCFLRRIFHRKIDQVPILSSSEKFDITTRKFKL